MNSVPVRRPRDIAEVPRYRGEVPDEVRRRERVAKMIALFRTLRASSHVGISPRTRAQRKRFERCVAGHSLFDAVD